MQVKPSYAASAALFTANALDSLATSSTLLAGLASAKRNNATDLWTSAHLAGRFKANNTVPTAGRIEVWAAAILNDTPTYPENQGGSGFDGTEKAVTITSADIKVAVMKNVASIVTDATANRIYEFDGIDLANLFGGKMPAQWWVWVTHSMVQALNTTTGNGGQVWVTGQQILVE